MSKKTTLFALVLVAILAGGGYWYYRTINFIGLTHTIDRGLDEATRAYVQEQLSTAQQSLETAKKNGDEINLNLYMAIAQNAYLMGDLVTARRAIEAQLDGNSLNYTAWNTYAQILEDMGDLQKADGAYAQAIDLGGNVEEFVRQYISFLQEHYPERTEVVKNLLEQSVAVGGQTVWNMQTLARWYRDNRDCYQMNAHYKVAVALAPENENIGKDWEGDKTMCAELTAERREER
jgi:tetratricopeptide (TPR) repeat protein